MQKIHTTTTLICLPFAGGSAHSFRPLEEHLGSFCRIKCVELPGRGWRFEEPLLRSADALAADAWEQIKPWTSGPYALLGHSMGGLLAYLVVHRARQAGRRLPVHLFLSGREGPSVPEDEDLRYLLPYDAFKAKITGYGGLPKEIWHDDEIFTFFVPIIRADFEAVETWRYRPRPRLNVPATVLTGTEEDMTEEEIRAWQKEFSGEVHFEYFPGGHFFIFEQAEAVAAVIRRRLASIPSTA